MSDLSIKIISKLIESTIFLQNVHLGIKICIRFSLFEKLIRHGKNEREMQSR